MPAYRCPKHDIVFNSQETNWQKAYEDCPVCQQEKEAGQKEEDAVQPTSKSRKQR